MTKARAQSINAIKGGRPYDWIKNLALLSEHISSVDHLAALQLYEEEKVVNM